MKVKVYVFRGERDVNDEHWGDFIDYEDTPSEVYERDAREGENPRLDKPIVNEEMVDDGIHQKWVKTIVCCK